MKAIAKRLHQEGAQGRNRSCGATRRKCSPCEAGLRRRCGRFSAANSIAVSWCGIAPAGVMSIARCIRNGAGVGVGASSGNDKLRIVFDDLWARVQSRRADTGKALRFADGRHRRIIPLSSLNAATYGIVYCAIVGRRARTGGRKRVRKPVVGSTLAVPGVI